MHGGIADGKLDGTVGLMYLMLFAGVGLLWLLQTVWIREFWDRKLSVSLHFRDAYIYEGEESALEEVVVNDKWLPISALGVHFAMSRNLKFQKESSANSNVTDQTYRRDVFSFLFHQQVRRTLVFCGKRRGCYQISGVEVTGCDFFFNEIGSRTYAQHTQMFVFPAQVDTRRISFLCNVISGMVLSQNRLFPDPFEFSGIRGYVPSDPRNHINWKATSRTGELMVNQFDSTTSVDVTILFDVADPYILKNENLVEESVRIVSSLAARLIRQKMPVRVVGNATVADGVSRNVTVPDGMAGGTSALDESGAFCAYYPAGAGDADDLNRKLACMEVGTVRFSAAELLKEELGSGTDGRTYIFVSKNQEEETMEMVSRFVSANRQVLWVLPILKGQEVSELNVPNVKIVPWEYDSLYS